MTAPKLIEPHVPGHADRPTGHEFLDHTADVAVRVWAPELRALFEQAAAAFVELMVDPATVRPAQGRAVEVAGETHEELLVAWLSEVLFAFDADGFAPARAAVERLGEGRLRGRLWGERLDPARHEVRTLVKAVTYHNLAIERSARGFEVTIVFDV